MAKKKSYHTIDELLEQQRQNAFSNFSVGDNKEYHTIDEIKKAATEQGLLTERAPATQPSAQTTSGRRNLMIRNNQIKNDSRQWKQNQVDGSNPFDLRNQVYKTQNETIPRIAQQAASDYVKNRMGYNYISQYGDDTRYSDVSNDISRVQQLKGGAARRGKDTEVYDRALDMLKDYASYNRNLAETMTVDEVRAKKNESTDQKDQDRENYTWLANYNNGDIFAQDEKEGEQNRLKAEQLTKYFKDKYGIDDVSLENAVDFGSKTRSSDIAYFDEDGEAVTWDNYLRIKSAETKLNDISNNKDVNDIYSKNVTDYDDINQIDKAIDMVNLSFSNATDNNTPTISTDEQRAITAYLSDKYNIDFSKDVNDVLTDLNNVRAEVENQFESDRESLSQAGYDWEELNYYNQYVKDKEEYQRRKAENEQFATEHPVAATLSSIAVAPAKVFDLAQNVAESFKSNDADETSALGLSNIYNDYNVNTANQYTSKVSQNINESVKESTNSDVLAWLASNSYSGISSSAQSAMTNAACVAMFGPQAGEVVALGLMGTEAAADGFNNAVRNGSNNKEALFSALATGVNEVMFEKLSFDHLMKMKGNLDTKSLKGFVKSALKSSPEMLVQGLVEADEEVNTDIANTITDYIINGNHSEYNNSIERYISQGYSKEEAEKLASEDKWKQLLESAYGGFIGGATAGSGKVAVNTAKAAVNSVSNRAERNQYIRNVGEDVTGAGNAQALLDRAAQIDDPAVKAQAQRTQQALDKATQNSTKSTNNRLSRETGKLYAAMQDSTAQGIQNAEANEIKAAIKSAYAAETGETDNSVISKAADAIYKSEYTDERLTRSERNLAETAAAQSALESVKNNPDLIESATQKAQERGFRDYVETAKLTQKQETKTDDDVDIAEFNYHEDDGKVYTSDGKKQVDIASVASIGDNDITFALNDGQTESAKSLDMPTNQAVLAQSILDVQKKIGVPLTADIANTLYQGYEQSDSPSVSAYMQDAQTVLFNGYANNTAPDSSINLPQELRDQLYRMGRQLAASHTQAQQQNVNARVKGNKSRKGTVSFQDGINRNKLDPRRRAGVDAVEHLAQSLGFDVVFYRSTKDGKGRFSSEYVRKNKFVADGQQAPSGFWRGGKMYLDINAGMNGEGLILFTASHELVHMIREGSPEDFKALSDFLVKNYAEQGVDINDLVRKEMARSTNLTRDQALEEVIAESCETFLRDTTLNDKAQELYKQNPTLWSRIREALKRIVDAVKQWYSVAKPQSEEARITMRADVETIENAYDLWTKGIIKSAENLRNTERTENRETRYSFAGRNAETADIGTLSDAILAEEEGATSEEIRKQTGWFRGLDGKWRFEIDDSDMKIKIIDKDSYYISELVDHPQLFKAYPDLDDVIVAFDDMPNDERGFYDRQQNLIVINSNIKTEPEKVLNTLVHEIQHAVQRIEGFASGASVSYWQSELNSVEGDTRTLSEKEREKDLWRKYEEAKKESPEFVEQAQRLFWLTQEVFFEDKGGAKEIEEIGKLQKSLYEKYGFDKVSKFSGLLLDLKRLSGKKGYKSAPIDLYESTAGEIEARDVSNRRALTAEQRKNTRPDIDRKDVVFAKYQSRVDSDYLSAVERGDMDTAQRMVDEAAERAFAKSKIRDEDGNLTKVYHGTDADFTVFDRAMGRANMDIQGMFFSPWDIDAGGYGSNVRAFYLNITNPANESTGYKALNSHKGENYAGIKAREDLERMGYDGVNNSDEEYIAFNSEQIKLADPVTYDDNGDVIPLSQRFDSTKTDIRYQSRDDLFSTDDMFDDDSISSTVAREYITHHEDIGEVLRNIADIELPSSKVQSIVNRVIRNELGYLDEEARRTLSIELQLALERVSKTDAQDVSNEMINAVRKAVEGARITDERTQTSYQELRNVFKGKKYFLSDEQINQLKEHDMTFDDFRKAMFGKVTIVKRENAKRSINGGYADAQQLSLEGLHDLLDNPEEVLGIRRDEWDNKNYDAPYIIKRAFDTLREQQSQLVTDMYSDEAIDDMAIAIAAKITGDIVEEKYKSKYKGKNSQQIRQALASQQKQTNDYIDSLVEKLMEKHETELAEQKERNKQKLAELKTKERERAEKREQDLKKKYQEQRDRNREGRKRTELRGKIRKLTDSLQRRLTAPKGKQYVPRELISQTVDVLNAVNLDSGRSTRLSEKLAALRNEYDKLKEREESYAMYDGVISNMLLGLSDSVGNTPIMNMTLSQLKQVYDVIRSMDYVIRESVKMTDTNFKKETHQIGRDWIAEIKAVPKEHVGLLSGYVQTMLSAERFFNRIAGFKKNSTSSQLFDMLNKGQLAQTQYEMEFTQIFADLIQDKQLKSLYDTKNLVDIGLEDEDGNKVPITRGMMLSLYMHLLNEDNTRHVMGGGLTVPDMKDYYKGDVKKAFGSGMTSVRVGALDYSQYAEGIKSVIERQLTEYEIKWIEAAQEFFDVASRKALNETTMKLYGFRRANVNNYFPIHTDSNYRAATFENITKDMSLENSGFMKERVKASNPILLEDIVDVINDQISKVAKYCGMTLPIRNFQKVYGTTTFGFETSVQRELNKKFSSSSKNTGATKYIDNLMTDLTSGRSTDEGFIARMMGRARGNLAQATLTLNPRVAIAQAASYPTAAAVIGWEPLFKALRKGGKNNTVFSRADREAIAEISPLLWKRTQGYSNVEIGDIKELRKQRHQVEGKLKKAMGWIEFFDGMTVGRLFYACQYYVDEQNPELKRGTAEYNAKVADVYNKVIERTQPNYTTLQRPDILRNPNALIKSLSMFMTQRLQNFNIVYDAVGTYNRYLNDYKKGLNEVTAEDVKGARKTLVRSVTSQLVAAGTIVGMKLLADVLLHSMNAYRDDDDELTAESVSLKLLDNFADTLFGSVLFGSDLYSLLKSAISGSRYYGISLSGVDSLVDAVTNIVNLRKGITLESANKAATSICQLFGIPLNNAEKIGKAVYYWASDISGGEAFESGVNRTNKQNIHRYETRLNSGEKDKANEIVTAMLDDKISQGKTEKEAKSWLRGRFTETYKQRYIDAVNQKNAEEVKNIREILLSTGLYGSLPDLDKSLKKWLK